MQLKVKKIAKKLEIVVNPARFKQSLVQTYCGL